MKLPQAPGSRRRWGDVRLGDGWRGGEREGERIEEKRNEKEEDGAKRS